MLEAGNLSTYILLGVIIIVSLVGFNNREFMEKYLFYPFGVKHYGENYRFLTHAFLHLDATHLIFNGLTMFLFGPIVESWLIAIHGVNMGEGLFWILVVGAMLGSSVISYFRHQNNPGYKSLGFSGVTSAIVFAFILFEPTKEIGFFILPPVIPGWLFGFLYLAFEIYSDRNKKTNIAHDAHIAGAVFGVIFIFLTNIEVVMNNFRALIG